MLRQQVVRASHDSVYGGHFGVQRTMDRIEMSYLVDRLFHHTTNWVAGCPDCGAIHPLRPMSIGAIGDMWILDLFVPFPGTPRGNKYLIVIMEYVTRYAVVSPIHSRKSEVIAADVSRVLHTFGLCRELVSNGAGELAGRVAEEMCLLNQISISHPMPHRHQMFGVESLFEDVVDGSRRVDRSRR